MSAAEPMDTPSEAASLQAAPARGLPVAGPPGCSYRSRPGVALGTGTVTAVLAVTGAAHPRTWTAVTWLLTALVVATAVRRVQRSVVNRAQPLAEPDVLAADDAIRSRSLHVLAGGGAALILLVVTAQVSSIHLTALEADNAVQAWLLVAIVLIAALGWNVATVAWPPRRPSGRAAPRHRVRRDSGHAVIVEVDTTNPTPPYEQIRGQVATMIAAGTLAPGAQLPPIRQLAADLGLAANTVARAYRELESAGLVASRVRHGTTVTTTRPELPHGEVRRRSTRPPTPTPPPCASSGWIRSRRKRLCAPRLAR